MNNCICCNQNNIKNVIITRDDIYYSECANCKSVYQNPIININYTNIKYSDFIDIDGTTRNLKIEINFKIKNWYGNTFNYVNSLNAGKILDVGAGLGIFLSKVNNKWEKHAQDLNSESIKYIDKNYNDVTTHLTKIEDLEFKDYFDVIMLYHVIEHSEAPDELLSITNSLLKKKGILIIGTPNCRSIAAKIFKGNYRMYDVGHVCIYNEKSLKRILTNNNYYVLEKEFPYFKTDYFNMGNILRLFKPWGISPPFYGNIMTFYCQKM